MDSQVSRAGYFISEETAPEHTGIEGWVGLVAGLNVVTVRNKVASRVGN